MNLDYEVLIVDDEKTMCDVLSKALIMEGYKVNCASDCSSALEFLKDSFPDLLITDMRMPGSGEKLIRHVRENSLSTAIIIMTAHADEETIKFSEENDISILLVKPFSLHQLKISSLKAIESRKALTGIPPADSSDLGLIGVSQYIEELRKKIRINGRDRIPVLIQGESGTGKEIIAQALHKCSDRQENRIITVNCAAIPHHLEESEFFGYTRGAFTGANSMKHGIISSADNSTLFLDEIGELSLEIQAKLLRVLDTGEFTRIGETTSRKVNLRIISATNRNLEMMVETGEFRRDLFYRLNGCIITTSPLREHREDIPSLVNHFLNRKNGSEGSYHLTSQALTELMEYNWPGNVRQLLHTIDLLCNFCRETKRINATAVIEVLKPGQKETDFCNTTYNEAKENVLIHFETRYFTQLLRKHQGNLNQAAKTAGIYRPNLIKKLKHIEINPDDFRPAKKKKCEGQL